AVDVSGGSVANTMVGIPSLGGRAAFIGKVAADEFGQIFAHDIRAAGVHFDTAASSSGIPTARCLILVTPDGERTMNTYLGISPDLDGGEVDPEVIRSRSEERRVEKECRVRRTKRAMKNKSDKR